jgi:hypothetical protein
MLTRALILLLLVLNVGVGAWWVLAPHDVPTQPMPPRTAPRLQLLGEGPARSQPAPTVPSPVAPTTVAPAAPAATASGDVQCWRFGPFSDAAALSHAQTWLQSRTARISVASVPAPGRGWRVWLPPLADHDTAQAMAQQIVAAGFSDYYVVPTGAEANSIALGRYGNADAAQRRQAALQAAGFDAKAEPLGATTQWIAVAAAPGFDAEAARAAIGAVQRETLDCTQLH